MPSWEIPRLLRSLTWAERDGREGWLLWHLGTKWGELNICSCSYKEKGRLPLVSSSVCFCYYKRSFMLDVHIRNDTLLPDLPLYCAKHLLTQSLCHFSGAWEEVWGCCRWYSLQAGTSAHQSSPLWRGSSQRQVKAFHRDACGLLFLSVSSFHLLPCSWTSHQEGCTNFCWTQPFLPPTL